MPGGFTMTYSHSFAATFYAYGDDYDRSNDYFRRKRSAKPCTVAEALMKMSKRDWDRMARDVFNCKGEFVDIDTVMLKIVETNTVSNLDSPVRVWIDAEGYWTVDVYDSDESDD
jgi:hypothetical protein